MAAEAAPSAFVVQTPEQQTVAAALATLLHHSSRGLRKARAGEEESETQYTDKDWKTPPPQPVLFKLFDEEPGGGRPEAFAEPRPQERVLRHTAEQIGDVAPVVPALGVLEPQMVDQLVAVLRPVDSPVPDQIIAVPKISLPSRPLRAAPCRHADGGTAGGCAYRRGGLDGDGHGGRGGGGGGVGAPHLDRRQ